MPATQTYKGTRARVEDYFDRTATKTWERLTSDAPVSHIRETVRRGRDEMRAKILSCLPDDLTGRRVLDAGCGAGQMAQELAARGARVKAVDISPSLVEIAEKRLDPTLRDQVEFASGDMLDEAHGTFDHVIAMDSLIYYNGQDIGRAMARLAPRVGSNIVFTIAPRTLFLMAFWGMGKVFPYSDRSPIMIPHAPKKLAQQVKASGDLDEVGRVTSGFYISTCLKLTPNTLSDPMKVAAE